ncbi:ABC transporter permease [Horticoccus sp. 23ND18S-11]|uniref:ABC transporter permease n=1 Tax=Horticoccus sp. 23ND18S-11 TaxID=3391832 RepID=UPI0039C93A67
MMPFLINLRIAASAIRHAWRRNLLALGGLAVGIAAVVAMLALTVIVRREALRQFDRSGLDVLALRKSSTTANPAGRRPPVLDLETVRQMAAAVPALERVAPLMERRVTIGFAGRALQTTLLGVTEAFSDLNGLSAAEGRLLTDFDRTEPHVVIGRDQAVNLRGGGSTPLLGRQITVEGRLLTIVGVLGPAQAIRLHQGDLNQAMLLPAETFARVLDGAEISVIYAQHRGDASPAEVIADAIADLQARVEGLGLQGTSAAEFVAEMQRQLRLFALLLGATGSIALVLGGTGILNGLMTAVAERRQEIGLRRALGALRSDIHAQFMDEAVILCAVGGSIGVPLGLVATRIIAWKAGWAYFLSPAIPAAGIALALVVGAVAGFLPAFQAARLRPVVAMKPTT